MSDLKRISELAKRQVKLMLDLAELEEEVKAKKEELRQVAEGDLPEAMAAAGMEEFTLADGRKVKVKQEYYASITEKNSGEALAWLREHGHDAIIKRDIVLSFGKGSDEEAEVTFEFLSQMYPEQDLKDKTGVHAATLKAWVRSQMEAGEEIPQELFGVFIRNVAEIGVAKK